MNLFRIDFYQGKIGESNYGQVVHSLEDAAGEGRKVINLSISGQKLQGVSNYVREPVRVVFECVATGWMRYFLIDASSTLFERDRYVSNFEVIIYRDGERIFTGIIDKSLTEYDPGTEVVQITCYDKLKLLSLYSDLKHFYALTSGYQPEWILGYFLQDISQATPVSIGYASTLTLPAPAEAMDMELYRVKYDDLVELPDGSGGTSYRQSETWGYSAPKRGWRLDSMGNRVTFIFAHAFVGEEVIGGSVARYLGRYRGRIVRYFNGICGVVNEYDSDFELQAIDSPYDLLTEEQAKLVKWFTDNGVGSIDGLPLLTYMNQNTYYSNNYAGDRVEVRFLGNPWPSKLQPGKFYETMIEEQTSNLEALRAMLLLYNATLYCDSLGRIILANKEASGGVVYEVSNSDIISISESRANHEEPEMSQLQVLAGDTEILGEVVKAELLRFHSGKRRVEARIDRIDGREAVVLQGLVRLNGTAYRIYDVERDYARDEIRVKGWA